MQRYLTFVFGMIKDTVQAASRTIVLRRRAGNFSMNKHGAPIPWELQQSSQEFDPDSYRDWPVTLQQPGVARRMEKKRWSLHDRDRYSLLD